MRIAVAGFPRSGKTTAYPNALHTDDVMYLEWGQDSEEIARWFDDPDPDLVVEGTAVMRALRKIYAAGKPCPVDKLVFFTTPHQPLTPRQRQMGEAQRRIVEQLAHWLPRIEWRR